MPFALYILCVVITAGIVLILLYLKQDSRRFGAERQFDFARPLIDEWVSHCAEIDRCTLLAEEYFKTKNVSKKYHILAELVAYSAGKQSSQMQELGIRLQSFSDLYNSAAENYNKPLTEGCFAPVYQLLRFRALPYIRFDK